MGIWLSRMFWVRAYDMIFFMHV